MEINNLRKILEKRKEYKEQLSVESVKIENTMLQKIIDLMVTKTQDDKKVWYDGEKVIEKEEFIKEELVLSNIKETSKNYIIPAMVLHILSASHDEFVKRKLINFTSDLKNDEDKCMPFTLLSWEQAQENLEILQPILQALEIEYDEKEVKDEFERQQIVYLINNDIFSKDDLKQRIKQGYKFYEVFYDMENKNSEDINQLLKDDAFAEKLTEKISQRIDLNLKNNLKRFMEIDKKEVGYVQIRDLANKKEFWSHTNIIAQKIIGFRKQALPKINKPMPKFMYRLSSECGMVFPKDIYKHEYYYYNMDSVKSEKTLFLSYEESTEEQKKNIERRNRKFAKFKANVEKSNSKKYDRKGIISIAIVDNSHNIKLRYKNYEKDIYNANKEKKIIQMIFSQRELAQIGVLPSEIGWIPTKTRKNKHKSIVGEYKENDLNKNELVKQSKVTEESEFIKGLKEKAKKEPEIGPEKRPGKNNKEIDVSNKIYKQENSKDRDEK